MNEFGLALNDIRFSFSRILNPAEPGALPVQRIPMSGNKTELRKQLRQRRRSLSQGEHQTAAENLLAQLSRLESVRSASKIAVYLANDGEIDPVEVMKWCWSQDKACYVPIVVQTHLNSLLFAKIKEDMEFVNNRYEIPEPVVAKETLITADQLDLVLLPLVGFDRFGNRIGMGGGFYDTTFEFVKEQTIRKPELIGVAHELQRVEVIESESWDIPLSTVVTDQNVYQTEPGSRG